MKDHLVKLIEEQLGWGPGDTWSNKDFQELSERIFGNTGKRLSVTTLKRIWGRAELVANPSIATLDILSEFLGYESWRQFLQLNESGPSKNSALKMKGLSKALKGILGLLILISLVAVFWNDSFEGLKKTNEKPIPYSRDSIEFSFEKVSTGYPNTVIFRYDVGNLPFDSLTIYQSWDKSKRIPLTEPQGLVTSTYYLPGYFLTKLAINDEIVQEKDLYIPTNGWQGMFLGENKDITYLKQEELAMNGVLKVKTDVLPRLDLNPGASLYLANLGLKPEINGSDFSLESEFRMSMPSERSICRNIRFTVTGTKEVLSFQFSIPGCVGDLMFFLNKEMISGRNLDLSAFGLEGDAWVNCKINVQDNRITLMLNDKPIFNHELSSGIGSIGGVQFMFEGLGEIRTLNLTDTKKTIDLMNR